MNNSFKPNPNYPYKTDEINFKVDQIKPMKLEEPDSTIKMEFDADGNLISQYEAKHPSKIYREDSKDLQGLWDTSRLSKLFYKPK